MILNEKYYNALINKYSIREDCNKVVSLSFSMIFGNYRNKNVHFDFPKGYDLQQIINLLYEDLSQLIFKQHADITDYSVGDRLKRTKEKGKNIYVITKINGSLYFLTKERDNSNLEIKATFDCLKRHYIKIQKNTRNTTLSKYSDYFKKYNEYGFLPTHFTKKLVLIAGQTIWNGLENRSSIPSIYLPNTREGEQTIRKSIEGLEDCIVYITPKYEVCYEEIFKKNIAIDTILVCDTDLDSVPQIIQDQSKYYFKLIVLSNESNKQRPNNITLWNWQKEEIQLLEEKNSNKIEIACIEDEEFDCYIQHFEECMKYVSELEYPIKLKSYGYYLRLALNAIQEEQFDYLLMRLKNNKELEHNEGGYEDFGENNPKKALENLILYLKNNNPKKMALQKTISEICKKSIVVVDREDFEVFSTPRNSNYKIVTNTELKKLLKDNETYTKTIVFNSFNGSKDFDFIYNLPNNVRLVLYRQEKDLYFRQLQNHKKQLEEELTCTDRFSICGIKYEPIVEDQVKVSPTLEQIIERLDQRSNTVYDGYKSESDSILDDLEEEDITYKIFFTNGFEAEIKSNETVFNEKGDLIKAYKLKPNYKISVYPKEQFAENLLQIAIEVEPEKFGKINEHSIYWQELLKLLDKTFSSRDLLYKKLKELGLKVLPATIDAYFSGKRKFPMYNSDLYAICKAAEEIKQEEKILEEVFPQLKKSKQLYNSTMIALGRGVKQELRQFLKEKTVGEILQKKNFTEDTLRQFINKFMPLLTISKIEEIDNGQ